ncbi:MAG: hypothetical protein IPL55_06215 [Saprospiraceae bacterium]|jgi:hypothetical protein|nr:hypothetical protein [Saprospiraceae bacterium]
MHNSQKASLFGLIIILASCNLLDSERPVPFYLDLKNPSVNLPASNSLDTHKITDVWVFDRGQIIGIFPLPALVPIEFSDSSSEITILAGIRDNGMNDQPVFYPFYKSLEKVIKASPNEIISIPLDFQYISNAKIPINESFETGNCFTIAFDGQPQSFLTISDQFATIGNKSALISLTNNNLILETGCSNRIKNGENARGKSYLELDYRGQGEIAVGVAKISGNIIRIDYALYIPAKETWNKIYVNLTDKLSASDYNEYNIVLSFRKTGLGDESKIYIDNIKHIHF